MLFTKTRHGYQIILIQGFYAQAPFLTPRCFFLSASLLCGQVVDAGYLSLQKRISEIYKNRKGVVVQVFAAVDRPATKIPENKDDEQPLLSKSLLFVGSGFFISREGHILTNASICYGADRVWIEYQGLYYSAEPVGHDLITNLSILKVHELPIGMQHVTLPNVNDLAEPSSLVLAITRQVGLPPSPAMGIITGQDIQFGNRILPTTYLRADIASQTGESGSPVFDLNGQLVGMMIASLPEIRSSFILPVKAIRRVRDDIIFSGEVRYAWFGLKATQTNLRDHQTRVVLDEVVNGSPAAAAEFKVGDILKRIGDFIIDDDRALREAVFYTPPEQNVGVVVERNGEIIEFPMKVGLREFNEPDLPEERQNAARQAAIPGQEIRLSPPILPDATALPKAPKPQQAPLKENAETEVEKSAEPSSQETQDANIPRPIDPRPLGENQIERKR